MMKKVMFLIVLEDLTKTVGTLLIIYNTMGMCNIGTSSL